MANESNIEPDDIKSIPTFRAAYSDRTALLMAKLAYRAYDKFDKDDNAFGAFQQDFTRLASSIVPAWLTRCWNGGLRRGRPRPHCGGVPRHRKLARLADNMNVSCGVAGRGQGAHWLLPGLSSNS